VEIFTSIIAVIYVIVVFIMSCSAVTNKCSLVWRFWNIVELYLTPDVECFGDVWHHTVMQCTASGVNEPLHRFCFCLNSLTMLIITCAREMCHNKIMCVLWLSVMWRLSSRPVNERLQLLVRLCWLLKQAGKCVACALLYNYGRLLIPLCMFMCWNWWLPVVVADMSLC